MGLGNKLLSKLLGQFGQLLFYVHSNSCAEFTTKQNELRLKADIVQKHVSRNLAFGLVLVNAPIGWSRSDTSRDHPFDEYPSTPTYAPSALLKLESRRAHYLFGCEFRATTSSDSRAAALKIPLLINETSARRRLS